MVFSIVMTIRRISKRQTRLAILMRGTSGPIRASEVMRLLELNRAQSSKLLARWHKQGVMRRISPGLYVFIQPSAVGQEQVLEDPWILVPELYTPGYIGGWTALEHWDLTEQLFRSVCVLTSKRVLYGNRKHQGIGFFVKYIPEQRLFGTETLWRDGKKIQISDIHKTILDIVDDPYLGAGSQHMIDCLREYQELQKDGKTLGRLLEYAIRVNNGALFKKLGYLGEQLGFSNDFVSECSKRITTGNARLDKKASSVKLVTRWRLWVPKGIEI